MRLYDRVLNQAMAEYSGDEERAVNAIEAMSPLEVIRLISRSIGDEDIMSCPECDNQRELRRTGRA